MIGSGSFQPQRCWNFVVRTTLLELRCGNYVVRTTLWELRCWNCVVGTTLLELNCWNYVVGTVLLKDSRRHSPKGHSCLHIRCFATLALRASVAIAVVIKAPFPIPIVIPRDIRTEGERTADHARRILVNAEVAVGVIAEVWRLVVHHAFPAVAVV